MKQISISRDDGVIGRDLPLPGAQRDLGAVVDAVHLGPFVDRGACRLGRAGQSQGIIQRVDMTRAAIKDATHIAW
jgi:hypothetical protein